MSVRFDNVISAQALLVTSATSEMAATTPKNTKLGRAPGAREERVMTGPGREAGGGKDAGAGTSADGATASTSGAGEACCGAGSVGSLLLILRVEFLRQLAAKGHLVQYPEAGQNLSLGPVSKNVPVPKKWTPGRKGEIGTGTGTGARAL